MGKNILVVDDNKLILHTLKRLLRGAGYETALAKNGIEAIEKIKKDRFDLIITDIRMPGLSGIDAIARIREFLRAENRVLVPEVVITGYDTEENLKKVEELKVAGFLNKPFDMNALLSCVERNIKKKNLMSNYTL